MTKSLRTKSFQNSLPDFTLNDFVENPRPVPPLRTLEVST